MNRPVMYSRGRFCHIFWEKDFVFVDPSPILRPARAKPKIVISAPVEINHSCTGKKEALFYFLMSCHHYVYYVDETTILQQNEMKADNLPYSRSESPDKDCIFEQLLPEPLKDSTHLVSRKSLQGKVYKLQEKDKVWEASGCDIICLNSYLDLIIITTKNNISKKYNINILKNGHHIVASTSGLQLELQITIPVKELTSLSPGLHDTKKDIDVNNRSSVYIITSSNFSDSESALSSVILPHDLFSVLFNKNCVLLNSPVILFCRDDGCVFYFFLKKHLDKSLNSFNLFCEVSSSIVGIYHLQVTKIQNASVESKEEELYVADTVKLLPALVVVSCRGEVYLVMVIDSKKSLFSSSISGPVVCVCKHNNTHLYHCNDRSIYSTKFYFIEHDKRIKAETILTHDVSVTDMFISNKESNEGEQDILVCRARNNTILSSSMNNSSKPTTSPNLKDILYSIEQERLMLTRISFHHKQLNEVIQQLNLGAHILHQLPSERLISPYNRLLLCEVKIHTSIEGTLHRHHLNVKVTNQTSMAIAPDWSVVASLSFSNEVKTVSHSLKLTSKWQPNTHLHMRVPVGEEITDAQVFLVLNKDLKLGTRKLDPVKMFVPIARFELNILDYLFNEMNYNSGRHGCGTDSHIDSQTFTAQLVVSTKQLASIDLFSKENNTGNTNDVLTFLLRNNNDNIVQVKDGLCRLGNKNGHLIVLSIMVRQGETNSNAKEEEFIINLHSDHCSLLASVRAAILKNTQGCPPRDLTMTVSNSRQIELQLEEIKLRIEEIFMRLHNNTEKMCVSDVHNVYQMLRQIQL